MRFVLTLVLCQALFAADRKVEPVKMGNDFADITGSAVVGREEVKALLGIDPEVDMIVVQIRIRPRADAGLTVSRDDFTLISRKDGQKSAAMHPSQIAGNGILMVQSNGQGASGGSFGQPNRPIWGGMPGTGGRPRRMGGDADVASVSEASAQSAVTSTGEGDSPVLAALRKKEVVQAKVVEPVSGLLYFILEGKHKLKDLELMYKTPEGLLILDFQK